MQALFAQFWNMILKNTAKQRGACFFHGATPEEQEQLTNAAVVVELPKADDKQKDKED